MADNPMFLGSVRNEAVTFVNADGTTAKSLFAAGANGSKVTRIAVTSTDSANRTLQLFAYDGSTAYLIGSVAVNDLSGTNGSTDPAVNLLSAVTMPWLDEDGELALENGWSLRVAPTVAITAALQMTIVAFGGDF